MINRKPSKQPFVETPEKNIILMGPPLCWLLCEILTRFLGLIMHTKKNYAPLIGWRRMYSLVIRVQITNSAHAFKISFVITSCDVFSWTSLTSNNMILLSHGLVQFCCLRKIFSCLSTPNCIRNHVLTTTNNTHAKLSACSSAEYTSINFKLCRKSKLSAESWK